MRALAGHASAHRVTPLAASQNTLALVTRLRKQKAAAAAQPRDHPPLPAFSTMIDTAMGWCAAVALSSFKTSSRADCACSIRRKIQWPNTRTEPPKKLI